MWVEFEGLRDDDPRERLKVVGWGNLAQEIQETYKLGDRLIIEGRLGMNTFDRQEGFKEKRAELTAQRIHRIGAESGAILTSSTSTSEPTTKPESQPEKAKPAKANRSTVSESTTSSTYSTASSSETADYDDIPF
jgi:single-stranded DNA-binding protein